MNLVRYDAARAALAEAARVDEAKEIRDRAAALQSYARQRNDADMERWVAEIKLRATVRIGELSATLEKAQAPPKHDGKGGKVSTGGKSTKADALKAAGISTTQAFRAEMLAAHPEVVESYIEAQKAERKPVKLQEAGALVAKRRSEVLGSRRLPRRPKDQQFDRVVFGVIVHVDLLRDLHGHIDNGDGRTASWLQQLRKARAGLAFVIHRLERHGEAE
ncbi:MAG: hypothetical protein ACREX3_03050 [Gammaproteobacteria bacterium]